MEKKNKGEFMGSCNITACDSIEPATWYNKSTEKYYCQSCAYRLNYDPYNHRDSMRLYGSLLCEQHDRDIYEQ